MKKIRLSISIVMLISISVYMSKAQTCPPIAWYKLDGNALDNSGNANNGILHGTTTVADRFGTPNSALYFNGTSDYMECNTDFDFQQRTISLWFKADVFPLNAAYMYCSDNNQMQYGAVNFIVSGYSGNSTINYVTGVNNYVTPGSPNVWYHMVLVDNSSTVKCYLNGTQVGTFAHNSASSSSGASVALIGCSRNFDRYFKGTIDDVRIYNCALSNEEVGELYSAGTTCGTTAHYELNGNATDQSGNGNNGILHGTTPVADRFGTPNSALYFNGTSDYMECNTDFDFQQKTISMWFKADVFPPNAAYMYCSDNNQMVYGAVNFIVSGYSGNSTINYVTGVNNYVTPGSPNVWYHMVLVDNSSTVKCYLNGAQVGTFAHNSGTSSSGASVALIGCSRNFDRYFKGTIDDVRIYNCALTDEEVTGIYTDTEDRYTEAGNIYLFPNPATTNLTAEIPQKTKIEILNIHGQLIKTINAVQKHTTIDISGFAKGMYLLRAENREGVVVKKFVKE